MLKNDKITLATDEKKVIELLINDSRQSPNEIALKLGFSRQKVWRIIKRLEKNKTIWGYTTVVDENSLGFNSYFALAKAKAPFYELIDELISRIKEKKPDKLNVRYHGQFYLHGTFDWLCVFSAKNIMDAKKFCGFIQKEYGEHIDRIELLENVFTLVRFGKVNPDIDKFKEIAAF
jgi:DNA-binding Lrp family transcriptional regulator